MAKPVVLIAGGGTGGHLMPALAIAGALREAGQVEPVLVGAVRGVEARLLPTRDFRYHLLPAEPLYRRTWWKNARWPLVAGRLLAQVRRLFREERPVAVVGTGGYASAPVVWWATRKGIPTALQEQNAYPGLTTRLLSPKVDRIYLGIPEARAHLEPGRRTVVVDSGNPIVPPEPSRREVARLRWGFPVGKPVVLVTGGSQGALALNRVVSACLDDGLTEAYSFLWVTGRGTHAQFAERHQPPAVQVVDFLDPMADGYAVADLVVGRAGAITVAELCAWGLPSILVPLPTAAADHQTHNARAMAAAGAAAFLAQGELTPARLAEALASLLDDPATRTRMAEAARDRGRPAAAGAIAADLLALIDARRSSAASDSGLH
ncbi:MAG TPA: undecaprenyldiphospho-muramoylpentapeptide beta-N-acetylglucosaminyltransferase [Gemmatimonadales bacterium]|nr:undecaprenyldiphospho-muramoylpentapeptide beta-N-acetylglucosaminyltransferase [Gemmatimonadales bacterium]